MTDWSGNDFPLTPAYETVLRRPPVVLLGFMAGVFALSIVMFAVDSKVGYGLCVLAKALGAFVTYRDQNARSSPNYVMLGWFRPLNMLLSYGTLLVASAHIAILAIESAR